MDGQWASAPYNFTDQFRTGGKADYVNHIIIIIIIITAPPTRKFSDLPPSLYTIEDGRIANMHGVTRYTTVATISEECHAVCHYSFTAFTWSLLDGTAHRGSFVI